MLNSFRATPKFWKDNKLTTARKACPEETLDYRYTARGILYNYENDSSVRNKDIKEYLKNAKKFFAFQVACLAQLGYVFAMDDVSKEQTAYVGTYLDPNAEDDDGNVKEQINYNEVFSLAFDMAAVKWCEQNIHWAFADRITGTILNVSGLLNLDGGNPEAPMFSTHSDAVTDYLYTNASNRMSSLGLMLLLVGQIENKFTRAHREIYDALVAKDAPRLKDVLEKEWK